MVIMVMDGKIKHIKDSILDAESEISKLDPAILNIKGFSSYKIRHFLNNLLELPNINYLEIGVFTGSTFVSALYKNKCNSAYAIDNWSEFQGFVRGKKAKEQFLKNTKDFNITDFTLIEEDCFNVNLSKIKNKINIYFYDGNHEEVNQSNALKYYYPILADEFIYIVDDFDYSFIEKGTRKGISEMNLEVIYKKHLKSDKTNSIDSWWNGFFISILKK